MAKSYTFLSIADIHLGWKLFNLPDLAKDLLDAFIRAIDKAIELKVGYFIVLGDLFENNKPSPDLIAFVQSQTKRLKEAGITPIGIAGDHDKPVGNTTWVELSGFYPINDYTNNYRFIGFDYSDNSADNITLLRLAEHKDKVEWIFLHGQVPELFPFCEDKKKLNLKELDLHTMFPNLKGVLLGDVHAPFEGTIGDVRMKKPDVYIGYCGSLGVVRLDEIDNKKGLFYYDGQQLVRTPFTQDRNFIKIDIAVLTSAVTRLVDQYYDRYKGSREKKPVFIVEYTRATKELLPLINKLYEVAIVKTTLVRKDDKQRNEVVNIRSELKTNNRIEQVLKDCTTDPQVYHTTLSLLQADDYKPILDKFKERLL